MTGRAGAFTTTIGIDTRDVVVDRTAHHRKADRHVDAMFAAIKFDIGNYRHAPPTPRSLIYGTTMPCSPCLGKADLEGTGAALATPTSRPCRRRCRACGSAHALPLNTPWRTPPRSTTTAVPVQFFLRALLNR